MTLDSPRPAFIPRPKQAAVLAYTGGLMGVAAVPGSGKTHVLAALAAALVAEGHLDDDQEVLIVTLVNSAVDNFARRVDEFVAGRGLLPHVGYRVRTLHGLAHDIVRERPGLVGLAEDFIIVDEREATEMLRGAAEAWVATHAESAEQFLDPELEGRRRERVTRDEWPRLVADLAMSFIRTAKDLELTPQRLRQLLDEYAAATGNKNNLPLLEMGCAIYSDYARALAYRGGVDFDDLIRLALQALRLDGDYLARLRTRWPYVLEDEAQDSNRLQEQILRLLTGSDDPTASASGRGWVRVGDPNQAIFETFTTASPKFLRDFLAEPTVIARELPNSGRSTRSIMALANRLVDWTRTEHPVPALRDALAPTHIEPTPPDDPQPNPEDRPDQVRLISTRFTAGEELDWVLADLQRWLPSHGDKTVAILVPRNERGEAVVNALKARSIECVELLRSTRSTREIAGALGNIVNYLADPASPKKLATAWEVLHRREREDARAWAGIEVVSRALRRCSRVEDFLWPRGETESLAALGLGELDDATAAALLTFRDIVRRWQGAATLPIDQLLLTIAGDLFSQPDKNQAGQTAQALAVTHKLAVVLRQLAESHPGWRLPELTQELAVIARNERKFLGFAEEDSGFDPDKHRGKVCVATIHKAKGLEWNRVYLLSVNAYDFPAGLPGDHFIAEKWFVRDQLNLEAEALAQLRALWAGDAAGLTAAPGAATRQARLDYAAERLRLLYVGITRAREELIITTNTGRPGGPTIAPAAALLALRAWWETQRPQKA